MTLIVQVFKAFDSYDEFDSEEFLKINYPEYSALEGEYLVLVRHSDTGDIVKAGISSTYGKDKLSNIKWWQYPERIILPKPYEDFRKPSLGLTIKTFVTQGPVKLYHIYDEGFLCGWFDLVENIKVVNKSKPLNFYIVEDINALDIYPDDDETQEEADAPLYQAYPEYVSGDGPLLLLRESITHEIIAVGVPGEVDKEFMSSIKQWDLSKVKFPESVLSRTYPNTSYSIRKVKGKIEVFSLQNSVRGIFNLTK